MPSIAHHNHDEFICEIKRELDSYNISASTIQISSALAASQGASNYKELVSRLPLALDASEEANHRFKAYIESVAGINAANGIFPAPEFALQDVLVGLPGTVLVAPVGKSFGVTITWTDLENPVSEPFIVHNTGLFDGKIRNNQSVYRVGRRVSPAYWEYQRQCFLSIVRSVCTGYEPEGPRGEPVFTHGAAVALAELSEHFATLNQNKEVKGMNPEYFTCGCEHRLPGTTDLDLARLAHDLVYHSDDNCCDTSDVLANLKAKRREFELSQSWVPTWLYRTKIYLSGCFKKRD
jgi:hypothetical protein